MRVEFFEFAITDFEQVYVIVDDKRNLLHISSVHYNYNLTLDLKRDLNMQMEQITKIGEQNFNNKVRQVFQKIIRELRL